jgi:hypothetical protein
MDLRRFFDTDCLVIGDDGVQLAIVSAHRRASIAQARWTRLLLLIGALQQSAKLRHPHLSKPAWGGRRLQPGLRFERGE